MPDYQTALNQVILAQQMFDELPSQVRKEFNNNPTEFVEYCQNTDNYEHLIELGLAEPTQAFIDQQAAAQAAQDTKNDDSNDDKSSSVQNRSFNGDE